MSIFNSMRKENVIRKEYSYTMGDVNLKFTLRTDIKKEMVAFKQLMSAAIAEIEDDLEKLGK